MQPITVNKDLITKAEVFNCYHRKDKVGCLFSDQVINLLDLHTVQEIERIEKPSSPYEFYKNYVAQNKPVIITGKCSVNLAHLIITDAVWNWPAFKKWDNSYFRKTMGDNKVTVDATPNGFGDAIVNGTHFVKPDELQMTINEFFDYIEKKSPTSDVYYLQHQNSNFTTEFLPIQEDVDDHIPWVSLYPFF